MRKDTLVYLSGPITAKHGYSIEENIASALAAFLECTRQGLPAFCPHFTAAFPSTAAVDYETWMAYDFAVLDHCTHVLMLPRWSISDGAKREYDYAVRRGIPVYTTMHAMLRDLGLVTA